MSITDDIKQHWRNGGMLKRLLIVNLAVFLAIWAVEIIGWVFGERGLSNYLLDQLMGTSNGPALLRKPWTPITYMFTHQAPMHLFWNMVMFWFSGQIFQSILGDRRMLGNYLLGGLTGFGFYALGSFLPSHLALGSEGPILGASAAVMSVFIGVASYRPEMQVNLFLLGPVRLKYLGIAVLVLDLIAIQEGGNTGGHMAHLGGALYGFLAARQLAKGNDWSIWFVDRLERIVRSLTLRKGRRMRVERPSERSRSKRRNQMDADADFNAAKKRKQERIDAILDKISRSGYDSLSKEDRDLLFHAGNDH